MPRQEETEELLDQWVHARRTRNYGAADSLRDKLRELNIEPEVSRPANRDKRRAATRRGPDEDY